MTDSVNQKFPAGYASADYWTANNPNALNEYDDGLNPVWINREPKAPVFAENRTVRVYKNKNRKINAWTIPDAINWA